MIYVALRPLYITLPTYVFWVVFIPNQIKLIIISLNVSPTVKNNRSFREYKYELRFLQLGQPECQQTK